MLYRASAIRMHEADEVMMVMVVVVMMMMMKTVVKMMVMVMVVMYDCAWCLSRTWQYV